MKQTTDFIAGNYTDKYNKSSRLRWYLVNNFLSTFKRYLSLSTNLTSINSICEIGCGEGELLKLIRKQFPDADIHACDLSSSEIKKAKINCAGLNINFSIQDAQELTYDDKQFDLVIACEVLEHIPNPNKAINEIQRIGKYAVLSVPVEPLWRILNVLRFEYISDLGNTPGHLNHWSIRNFKIFLKSYRFRILRNKFQFPWQMYLTKIN